jgi:hypothetical protein
MKEEKLIVFMKNLSSQMKKINKIKMKEVKVKFYPTKKNYLYIIRDYYDKKYALNNPKNTFTIVGLEDFLIKYPECNIEYIDEQIKSMFYHYGTNWNWSVDYISSDDVIPNIIRDTNDTYSNLKNNFNNYETIIPFDI